MLTFSSSSSPDESDDDEEEEDDEELEDELEDDPSNLSPILARSPFFFFFLSFFPAFFPRYLSYSSFSRIFLFRCVSISITAKFTNSQTDIQTLRTFQSFTALYDFV